MKRITQLDGVRALAIALVIGSHGFGVGFGWAGVDLFFVLSGFLITGILRRSRQQESYWRTFYIKRATRILPPLFVFLVIVAIFFRLDLHALWLAYLLFCANVAEGLRGEGRSGPLGVLWSLAVEEHFYLIWPFAVRYLSRQKLLLLCGAILLLEPILRLVATPHFSNFAFVYNITIFRLDGLAAGSMLALLTEEDTSAQQTRRLALPLLLVGLTSYTVCKKFLPHFDRNSNSVAFNSLAYSLTALISAALIAYVLLDQRAVVTRMFKVRALVFVGSISYGLYLFHIIAFGLADKFFGRHHAHESALRLGFLMVSLLFSWTSFVLYEKPIMRWGHQRASQLVALTNNSAVVQV